MYPQPRIKADAIVDPGSFEVADRVNDLPFLVTVRGELFETGDKLEDRVYEIAAVDESHAAFAGLDQIGRAHV